MGSLHRIYAFEKSIHLSNKQSSVIVILIPKYIQNMY